jgi:hypothetical protein
MAAGRAAAKQPNPGGGVRAGTGNQSGPYWARHKRRCPGRRRAASIRRYLDPIGAICALRIVSGGGPTGASHDRRSSSGPRLPPEASAAVEPIGNAPSRSSAVRLTTRSSYTAKVASPSESAP